MSKYFDRLLKMNESLDAELEKRGLKFVKEAGDEEMVPVPADSLSDDQKKGILSDTLKDAGLKVDDKVVDELVKNPDEMAGVQKVLGDEQKENESGAVPLEDLDWDGPAILKFDNPNEPDYGGFYVKDGEWTSDIQAATEFDSKEAAQEKLDDLVDKKGMDGNYLYIWSAKSKFDEGEDVSDEVVIRMDDDDLDMHGYVPDDIEAELVLVDDEKDAAMFASREEAQKTIDDLCSRFHYDPSTFTFQDCESQVSVDGDAWISLDPMNGQATTVG